ncbi:hypothetical protein NB574_04065 [Vibrio vulnificus]|uniref:hypothetical protein n=1 Tax=Vibrio vulnificus TaxID=672 RepID=UPI00215BD452|nr:hypothetical protein [Vibrio vulnificus]MCR9701972.1 hypothetical protein [Vibrio vulnificus]
MSSSLKLRHAAYVIDKSGRGRYDFLQVLQQLNFLIAQATIAKIATVQLPRNTR